METHPSWYRSRWMEKSILRAVYEDYYKSIGSWCREGLTLEIGGGSGNLKAWLPQVVSTDIVHAGWLDCVADAHALPFPSNCFQNIVMIDVLHHLSCPMDFFSEAERVLLPGGRVVLLEPGISPVSRLFYKFFHSEPVDMAADPLSDQPQSRQDDPWDSNQAIPTLIFNRDRKRFEGMFPQLNIISTRWLSMFAYPLSGGFRRWQLLPTFVVSWLLRVEELMEPFLGALCGFRIMVVLEKNPLNRSTGNRP